MGIKSEDDEVSLNEGGLAGQQHSMQTSDLAWFHYWKYEGWNETCMQSRKCINQYTHLLSFSFFSVTPCLTPTAVLTVERGPSAAGLSSSPSRRSMGSLNCGVTLWGWAWPLVWGPLVV